MTPMPRPRLQFRLSTLLWITLAAAFIYGVWLGYQKRLNYPVWKPKIGTFLVPREE